MSNVIFGTPVWAGRGLKVSYLDAGCSVLECGVAREEVNECDGVDCAEEAALYKSIERSTSGEHIVHVRPNQSNDIQILQMYGTLQRLLIHIH